MEVRIEPSWKQKLEGEFGKAYFKELMEFVEREYASETIYPSLENLFRAFDLTPFNKVKVVILGQDPYHGPGQATGLSFAVEDGMTLPPSLRNIYKELESDLEQKVKHQNLARWAEHGVLLLNATLTVRARMPGSHQGKGWEMFTDAVIKLLSEEREHVVFILWGKYARSKGAHIDRTKHLVLESAHPSPFSASNGFFGSRPFSTSNAYLTEHGQTPVEWL